MRTGKKISNLSYGEWQDVSYHLYLPNTLKEQKSPALILFIHGGSYTGGDIKHYFKTIFKKQLKDQKRDCRQSNLFSFVKIE